MKDYKWYIGIYNNYIKLIKSRTNNYELEDLNIDFNEWDLYKATKRFKLINKEDIGKYAKFLIIKKDHHHYTDEFIKWYNQYSDLNITFLDKPITFNPWEIKVIESL